MIFQKTELKDAYIIDIEKRMDDRGFFARGWCQKEFDDHGLALRPVQANISFNKKSGTLRGLHYQVEPHAEKKLIRCVRGAIYDVIIDLRSNSSSYGNWIGVKLTDENHRLLYVPEGFAHGYLTLVDNTEVFYQVSEFYTPGSERGIRFNDPNFVIDWPIEVSTISDKDANWSDF